jgi:DNA modification methylase
MGSGTTARAAIRLGRRWLGCEISEDYVRQVAEPLIKLEMQKQDPAS